MLKNDANYIQGFPDLLILYRDKWAALECKAYPEAHLQPNQEYYIDLLNTMGGFCGLAYPENIEYVMEELIRRF